MKDLLVGSTGFVGGNLRQAHTFTAECHSVNVKDYYGSQPDYCIYAGVSSAMFLANTASERDFAIMQAARENLRKIRPKSVILISTIAVFGDSRGKDENDIPEAASAYGANRYQLENWVREDHPNVNIIRLPALYGIGLKKNLLFDMHNIVPAMLTQEKYALLSEESSIVQESYSLNANGFWVLDKECDFRSLRTWFNASDFNALSFTDSRSRFQFYSLKRLWNDIQTAIHEKLPLVHFCTPPVSARTVYQTVRHCDDWENHICSKQPFDYDLHSLYAEAFGGCGCYLCSLEEELRDIESFMMAWEEQEN